MIKLEEQDIIILLTIIENTQFNGKDIKSVCSILEKLEREMGKLNPTYVRE